jgi:hypothetical protein
VTNAPDAARTVAIAMFTATGDETDAETAFEALEPEDREQMLAIANVAMSAHMDWLIDNGFRLAPPGTMLRPKTKDDAHAMILAGKEFIDKGQGRPSSKSKLIGSPKLILPNGGTLQ